MDSRTHRQQSDLARTMSRSSKAGSTKINQPMWSYLQEYECHHEGMWEVLSEDHYGEALCSSQCTFHSQWVQLASGGSENREICTCIGIFFVCYTFSKRQKILDWPKLKASTDNKINVAQIVQVVLTLSQMTNFRLVQIARVCRLQFQFCWKWQKALQTGRKQCGKRRNCSLRAISPFPTVFSKDLYCRHIKTRACLGKG